MYLPRSQRRQNGWPSSPLVACPALHSRHRVVLISELPRYIPTLHFVHSSFPSVATNIPGPQFKHDDCPTLFWCCPALQARHFVLLVSELPRYIPFEHSSHLFIPCLTPYIPGLHSRHKGCPSLAGWYLPGAQS